MPIKIDQDIVVSTRVRLARNLHDLPFVQSMSETQHLSLQERIIKTINTNNDFKIYYMNKLTSLERKVLVERHISSKELIKKENGVLLLTSDEHVAIMIGEEDHVRIQCILPGFQIDAADELSASIDNVLSKQQYAFSQKLGHLTSCPTNIGTGMRASVMLHLPMLATIGHMQDLLDMVGKFGFTLRGFFGEGSRAQGDMYQLSNQVTLGVSEEDILMSLKQVVRTIIEKENATREAIVFSGGDLLEDKLHRSLGILKYARTLSTNEMMQKISDVKLGVSLDMFKGLDCSGLEKIIANAQPASVEIALEKELSQNQENKGIISSQQRDKKRAQIVRSALKKLVFKN